MNPLAHLQIAVLEGGPGTEREVSLRSGLNVAGWLEQAGAASVTRVDVRGGDFTLPAGTGFAFNIIHGTFGEDGQLQRVLDARGVPYSGEGAAASALAFDKILSKRRFEARGIATPAYEVIAAGQQPIMPLPLVIKSPCQGSSVGVHLVRRAEELAPALADVAQYGDEILVEALVSGLELTVGVLGDLALPIVLIQPKHGFYDFKNKYPWLNPGGVADHQCPAELPADVTARVQALALAAHRALDLETYSRVDILLDAHDEPTVLEVNTIPGMTESSLLPEAAKVIGIEPPELCARIIELSRARFSRPASA